MFLYVVHMLLHSIAYMQSQIHNEIHELYFTNQLTSMHFTVFWAASIFAGSSLWANEVECKISVQQSKAVKIHAHAHTKRERGRGNYYYKSKSKNTTTPSEKEMKEMTQYNTKNNIGSSCSKRRKTHSSRWWTLSVVWLSPSDVLFSQSVFTSATVALTKKSSHTHRPAGPWRIT